MESWWIHWKWHPKQKGDFLMEWLCWNRIYILCCEVDRNQGWETEQVAGNTSLGGTCDIFSAGRDRITPSLFWGTNCLELCSPKSSPENNSPDQVIQCLHKKPLCVCGMGLKGRSWVSYLSGSSANTFFQLPAWSWLFFKYFCIFSSIWNMFPIQSFRGEEQSPAELFLWMLTFPLDFSQG